MYVLRKEPFDLDLANQLVDHYNSDINHVDSYGDSILIKLVKMKNKKLVKFLLSKNALIHILDSN